MDMPVQPATPATPLFSPGFPASGVQPIIPKNLSTCICPTEVVEVSTNYIAHSGPTIVGQKDFLVHFNKELKAKQKTGTVSTTEFAVDLLEGQRVKCDAQKNLFRSDVF
jgi:hypothetical protein